MTDAPPKEWVLPQPVNTGDLPADVPRPIAELLARRGIDTAQKLRFFLEPPHQLPYDPQRMSGMDRAVGRLYQAVQRKETVGVFGDFDVDGVTGTAIISEGLTLLGVKVAPYLPRRSDEGHGLSNDAIDQLVGDGASLIVTVDCGITSVDEVAHARGMSVDVIITDHHLPQDEVPNAAAVLNPKLPGGTYPFYELCGAGLAFKLMQGLYEFYGQPWGPGLLELAALGTIADLVPLVDENRFLVKEGLAALGQTERPGLRALYKRAGVDPNQLDTETVSFQLAPRINSPGRMGHAMDSYMLLTTRSDAEAERLANQLEELNWTRRSVTEEAYNIAREQVSAHWARGAPPILIVEDPRIDGGVAGIVAGRLAETYNRPAVVMSTQGDNLVASARSIPGFNLVEAFATFQEIMVRYGGHAQAAGFTVPRDRLPEVTEALLVYAGSALDSLDTRHELIIDAEIDLDELNNDLLHWLAELQPYGQGNRAPKFLSRGLDVGGLRMMGPNGQHFALTVGGVGRMWTALGFNLGHDWVAGTGAVDLVYTVIDDHRQGPGAKALRVLDFRAS